MLPAQKPYIHITGEPGYDLMPGDTIQFYANARFEETDVDPVLYASHPCRDFNSTQRSFYLLPLEYVCFLRFLCSPVPRAYAGAPQETYRQENGPGANLHHYLHSCLEARLPRLPHRLQDHQPSQPLLAWLRDLLLRLARLPWQFHPWQR